MAEEMTIFRSPVPAWAAMLLASASCGCSGSDSTTSSSSGGATGQGGAVAAGGSTGIAGTISTGGTTSTSSAGGVAVSGGAPAIGGNHSTGGIAAPGGANSTGGIAATGGAATGGKSAAGGAATGGKSSTGGATTGGVATGGKSATGGAATGGTKATGGTSATGGSATSCPAAGATSTTLPTLGVQLSNQFRPVTHAASGSLYGLANDGVPPDSMIGPIKPFMFTQMAPNGQQLGNGATTPTGDALKVAPAAARAGAKVTIRMPDTYPNFPYQWVSWADWYSRVDAMVAATVNSGATNIYAYEIWNEPNWTWNNPNNTGTTFNDGWNNTYLRIKTKDTTTKIMGPSISIWDPNFMQSFLSYCKTNNCLPDIVSWHELGDANGVARPGYVPTSVAAYRAMETSLGISNRPISIDEYGVVAEEGVPGSMIRYIAQFERQGVESACIAYWHQSGLLSDLLTNAHVANGGWWLFKFYGDMTGTMAMTTPSATGATVLALDGVASIDATAQNVQVVFGGASGNNAIVIQGFSSAPFFSCNAHVVAQSTPWNGQNSAVSAPTTLFETDYPIGGGQIIVTINNMITSSGYRLTITPG